MKQQLLVLYYYLRSAFLKVALLLLLMSGVEIGLFAWQLKKAVAEQGEYFRSLEKLLQNSGIPWVLLVAFLGILLLSAVPGLRLGSHTEYTLRRLSVSNRSVYLWQLVTAIGFLLLLWGLQIALVLGFTAAYAKAAPAGAYTGQTLLLACYRSKFLNGLLPLGEATGFLRNILLLLAMACGVAGISLYSRKGKGLANGRSFGLLFALAFGIRSFQRQVGNLWMDLVVMGVMFVVILLVVYYDLLSKGVDEYEEA
jgi:hypothetical protein